MDAGPYFRTGPLIRTPFRGRPNRFIVRFGPPGGGDGPLGTAYLANPGRLGEILLAGADVLVERKPHTKIGWEAVGAAWEARWPGDRPRAVFLNTGRVNDLAERLLEARHIPELSDHRIVRREFTRAHSRFDFLLERNGRPYILEVKSVTLAEHGLALFPDARTDRGRRHLQELSRLRQEDAGVLFLVQGDRDTTRFLPDFNNDLAFARTFRAARGKIDILPYALQARLTNEGALVFETAPRRLEVPEDLLEAGTADSGLYLVILRLCRDRTISVGSLGRRLYRKGWYVYTGSARRALSKRLDRHLHARKVHHWHVDFLRAACDAARGLPIRAPAAGECDLAADLRGIAELVEGFGSTDCGCPGHLVRFAEDPFRTAPFQRVLVGWRHR